MKERITFNYLVDPYEEGENHKPMTLQRAMEASRLFTNATALVPNQIEMSAESSSQLLKEATPYASQHNHVVELERIMGLEIVVTPMRDDFFRVTLERTTFDGRVRMSEPAAR